MTPAAAAILEGMPDPRLLHRADGGGPTGILAGSVVVACSPSGDAGLRNVTVGVCRQLGFGGRAVAAVMGLTENYVATLHNRALREGTAGLVQAQGRPRKLAGNAWEKAARWRAEGASDSEIARRLGVAQSTVFRRLGPAAVQEQLPGGGPEDEPAAPGPQAGEPEPEAVTAAPGPGPSPAGALVRAGGREPAARPRARLAAAMLAADAPGLHVYYVDDHFVPYEGAKPVAKGWNTKRRHAQPGRADTMVADYHGRAVAFATGDPSGLAATLPPVLAQLRQVTGAEAKILLGFDRGGSYPVAFRAIRDARADWVTWRRGPLAPVTAAPRRHWAARGDGKPAEVLLLADETVEIKDYGQARQITLLADGSPVLQVLTSDTTAPAAALLAWLRCRWRIEDLFQYLEDHYGIHWLCDYHADTEDDDHLTANPERTAARARLREAEAALAAAERRLAGVISAPELSAAAKNKAIPPAEKKITKAREAVTTATAALKGIPARLPASQLTPGAHKSILRTRRRSLQMVLRLLAASAEHWLGNRLNDYLRDPNEYRAITRHLLHLGGTITSTPPVITVTLDPPAAPRITRPLALPIQESKATPPRMPGDTRPITYQLAADPRI